MLLLFVALAAFATAAPTAPAAAPPAAPAAPAAPPAPAAAAPAPPAAAAAQETLDFMRKQLQPQDRLSIVSFNDNVTIDFELQVPINSI